MMPDPLLVPVAGEETETTFGFVLNSISGDDTIRNYYDTNGVNRYRLRIAHSNVGSGSRKRVRTLVRFDAPRYLDQADMAEPDWQTPNSLYLVADVPEQGATVMIGESPEHIPGQLLRMLTGLMYGCSGVAANAYDDTDIVRVMQGES